MSTSAACLREDVITCGICSAPEANNTNVMRSLAEVPNCDCWNDTCHRPMPRHSNSKAVLKTSMFERDTSGIPGYNYHWHEVPEYLRRPCILRHYRAYLGPKDCLKSLFMIHNETFNCWSHGLGAMYFWFMCIYVTLSPPATFYWPIIVYCASHGIVFSVSLFAHTFNPINERCCICCFQFDWSAIAFAILGGGIAVINYIFACFPSKQQCYSVLLSLACLALFTVANTKWFIAKMPSFLALLAISPIILVASLIVYDVKKSAVINDYFVRDMQSPMFIAVIGVAVYVTRFPERLSPGSFDLIFNHHSFHHMWSLCFALMNLQNLISWSKIAESNICHIKN